jgi:hypothetical protein
MRRDPRIINLYDRPLYSRRSRVSHRDDPAGYGTNLLACTAIVALTGGFFWLYNAVAHRETPFMPAQSAAASANPSGPPTAIPAPGLNRPAAPSHAMTTAAAHEDTQRPTKTAEAPRKIKKIRAVKRIPEEAKQAFAFGFGFSRPPE